MHLRHFFFFKKLTLVWAHFRTRKTQQNTPQNNHSIYTPNMLRRYAPRVCASGRWMRATDSQCGGYGSTTGVRMGSSDVHNQDHAASGHSALDSSMRGEVGGMCSEGGPGSMEGISPWVRIMAVGLHLLRVPKYNKGLAFSRAERNQLRLTGLLPPGVINMTRQAERVMYNFDRAGDSLQQYITMTSLAERNETLFYRVVIDNIARMLPILYTPTVGEACQKFGLIWRRPKGLYISLREKGRIAEVLRNWPERLIDAIVVTDGERILGLGDLGAAGMGIPVGKLMLYSAVAGVHPSRTLPVCIDVGTNNEEYLRDPFYVGLRQNRVRGQAYLDLMDEFMVAVRNRYGRSCCVQFEDFNGDNARMLLSRYEKDFCCFNDDIQGTAAVALAGILTALPATPLPKAADHKFMFLGAGGAGCGIADLLSLSISQAAGIPIEEARKRIFMLDVNGLIRSERSKSITATQKPYAHEGLPEARSLQEAVDAIKPTCLIGVSSAHGAFSKKVIESMCAHAERPIIFALSNPTSHAECTAQQAYEWSDGRAIFASGSPFDAVTLADGRSFVPSQGNNVYIFPGVALAVLATQCRRVPEAFFLEAARKLSTLVTPEQLNQGQVFPNISDIRDVTARVAAAVAHKAYEMDVATKWPKPSNMEDYCRSVMYNPAYNRYNVPPDGPEEVMW